MSSWISMATTFNEVVDCRMIQLELEFHQVPKKQLTELAEFFVLETNKLFTETCYSRWKYCGRQHSFVSVLERIRKCKADFDFSFDTDVISDVVYNNKTFCIYDKLIQEGSNGKWRDYAISYDYSDYFHDWASSIQTPNQCKDAILRIINEPKKKKKALWRQHDISGSFISYAYMNDNSMFRGNFCLRIALECLNKNESAFSDALVEMVLKASVISPNVSARISLSPISPPAACSPHMMYFGGHVRDNQTHIEMGRLGIEWYPYYYFCGAEWFNLLSPLQASHLPNPVENSPSRSHVITIVYPNGAISTKLKKDINQVDVADLEHVRKLLYEALYPGQSEIYLTNLLNPNAFGFLAKIRQEWECIPIFPDEIEIDEKRILFHHQLKR